MSHTVRRLSLTSFLSILLVLVANNQLISQSFIAKRWYRICTPHADVIFRGNIEREAQRVANTLQYLYEPISQSLGILPPKITIILRNQKSTSNGGLEFVPRRVILYTYPPGDYNFIGSNTWLELLLSHEFRHVVQMQN